MFKGKKYIAASIAAGIALLATLFFVSERKEKQFVVFFCGSGMKIPAMEIVKNFTDITGIHVDMHFEGSSILRQHIELYGDAGVFMSGDKENLDVLAEKGLVKETAFIAWHAPAILVPAENRDKIKGLDDLSRKGIRVVIANPEQAASGKLIHGMLQRHPGGKEILNNVVACGSSTNDALKVFRRLYEKGAADTVLEWDVMINVPEGEGLAAVAIEKQYVVKNPLMIALLEPRGDWKAAQRFYDYFKKEGPGIFKKHGYNTEGDG